MLRRNDTRKTPMIIAQYQFGNVKIYKNCQIFLRDTLL